MTYNTQPEYDLAKAKQFLREMNLSNSFHVAIRNSNSQGSHYALIQTQNGHSQTVYKAYNIDDLMSYFTEGNDLISALWVEVEPLPLALKHNSPIQQANRGYNEPWGNH